MQRWPTSTMIDLFRLVGALYHRHTRLLKSGLPSKRDMQAFNQFLLVPLDLSDVRAFEDSGYLLFVYELAYQLDLFVERDGTPRPNFEACLQFAQSTPTEQQQALHKAYQKLVLWNEWSQLEHLHFQTPTEEIPLNDPTEVSAGQLNVARRKLLEHLPKWLETPISTEELLQKCLEELPDLLGFSHAPEDAYPGIHVPTDEEGWQPAAFPDHWMQIEGALCKQLLSTSLQWLGCVTYQQETWHYHAPAEPVAHPSELIAQSNLDLMLFPGHDQLRLLLELETFCKPLDGEHILRLRIDKKRFFNALQQGKDYEQMSQLLEATSRTPLPHNVLQLMQSWYTQSNQIVISKQGTIVEADTPEEFAALCANWPDDLPYRPLDTTRRFVPFHGIPRLRKWLREQQLRTQQIDYQRQPPKCLRIEANLQVDVIPPYDLLLLPFLERIAEPLHQGDEPIRYEITAASLTRALQAHLSFDELLDFLNSRAQIFSSTARLRLEAYAGQHEALSVTAMNVIQTPSEALLDRLLHEGGMGSYLVRLGPKAAAIPAQYHEEVNELLRSFSLPLAASIDQKGMDHE